MFLFKILITITIRRKLVPHLGCSLDCFFTFSIVDFDKIDITNLNRQLMAYHSNIGCYKTDEIEKRILDINPNANVEIHNITVYVIFDMRSNVISFDLNWWNAPYQKGGEE